MNWKFLFNKQNIIASISSLVLLIVGFMLIILPEFMKNILEIIVCYVFLAYSTIIIFAYCISPIVATNKKLIQSALVTFLLGILTLFIKDFVVIALTLILLIIGMNKFSTIKGMKDKNNLLFKLLISVIVLTAICVIVSLVFFVLNKFIKLAFIIIGICFVFDSLINVYILLKASKMIEIYENNQENETKE